MVAYACHLASQNNSKLFAMERPDTNPHCSGFTQASMNGQILIAMTLASSLYSSVCRVIDLHCSTALKSPVFGHRHISPLLKKGLSVPHSYTSLIAANTITLSYNQKSVKNSCVVPSCPGLFWVGSSCSASAISSAIIGLSITTFYCSATLTFNRCPYCSQSACHSSSGPCEAKTSKYALHNLLHLLLVCFDCLTFV